MEQGEIILYQPDEAVKLEVRLEDETVWLTQEQIADLFGTKRPAITKHLNNIYKSGELDIDSTCSILEHMGNDGKQRYTTKYYNLDAILSIGYRVNSKNATLFRKWANSVLKDYLLKGYSINKRLSELERTVAQHTEKIDHDPLQLSQQPVYQQPCPVKACLVRELCQLVQIVRHSRQAAQQRILFRRMPCRNGGRQCHLPDIDRQTPAGLPCPESESLVADGGELHCHSLGQLPHPAQCRTAAFFLHPIHILCHMFFLFRPYFFHSKNLRPAGADLPSLQPPEAGSKGFRESGNITLLPPTEKSPRIFHIEAGTQGTVHTSGTLHARLQAVRFFSTARCPHGRRQDAPWQGSPAVRKRSCHARRACGRRRPVRPSHPH